MLIIAAWRSIKEPAPFFKSFAHKRQQLVGDRSAEASMNRIHKRADQI